MPSPLYIALRFIGHRKKAIILSLGGIVLGVAFFICTQAQTQGFEQFFIQTVLGTSGSILVQDRFQERYSGILQPQGRSVRGVKLHFLRCGASDGNALLELQLRQASAQSSADGLGGVVH